MRPPRFPVIPWPVPGASAQRLCVSWVERHMDVTDLLVGFRPFRRESHQNVAAAPRSTIWGRGPPSWVWGGWLSTGQQRETSRTLTFVRMVSSLQA